MGRFLNHSRTLAPTLPPSKHNVLLAAALIDPRAQKGQNLAIT